MVNPVATILFDLFLVGTAVVLVAAMVAEALAARRPSVGTHLGRAHLARRSPRPAHGHDAGRLVEARRRARRRIAA
jgi:hypothetical protein